MVCNAKLNGKTLKAFRRYKRVLLTLKVIKLEVSMATIKTATEF